MLEAPTVLAKVQGGEELRRILDLVLEISNTLEGNARSDVANALIPVVAKSGLADELVRCLDQLDTIAARATAIGLELGARGRESLAEELLLELLPEARSAARSGSTDGELAIVRNLVRSRKLDRAQSVAAAIDDDRVRSLALSEVIITRLLERDVSAVRDVWIRTLDVPAEMTVEDLDLETTSVVASRLAQLGDEDGLESLYSSVLRDAHDVRGSTVPLGSYKTGDDVRHEALVEIGRQMTSGPFFKGRSQLLHVIRDDLDRIGVESTRSHLSLELAEALTEAGELDGALEMARGFSPFNRAWILAAVARAVAREESQVAFELLREALGELRKLLPPRYDYTSYPRFVESFCALPDQRLYRELMEQVVTDLERTKLDTRRAYTLLELGKALSEASEAPWAADLLARMAQAIREAEMGLLALELDERRAGILAAAGELDEALRVARAIDPMRNQQPRAVCRIIRVLAARRLYDSAFRAFALFSTETPRVEALQDMVKGLAGLDPSEEVTNWSLRCLEEIVRLDSAAERADLLREWLETLPVDSPPAKLCAALERELPALEETMYRGETEDARSSSLHRVVAGWALLGKTDRAFAVLERADAGEMVAAALGALTDLVAKRSPAEDKKQLFERILPLVEDFESDSSYVSALIDLAEAMARGSLSDEAADLLNRAALDFEPGSETRLKLLEQVVRISEGASDVRRQILEQRFPKIAEIESEEAQVQAVEELARHLSDLKSVRDLHSSLENPRVPSHVRQRFVCHWQKTLLEHEPAPLDLLRHTLCCFPFEGGLARVGARRLAAALLKSNRTEEYRAITSACPELGLPDVGPRP